MSRGFSREYRKKAFYRGLQFAISSCSLSDEPPPQKDLKPEMLKSAVSNTSSSARPWIEDEAERRRPPPRRASFSRVSQSGRRARRYENVASDAAGMGAFNFNLSSRYLYLDGDLRDGQLPAKRHAAFSGSFEFAVIEIIQIAVIVQALFIIGGYSPRTETRGLAYTAEHILALLCALGISAFVIYVAATYDHSMKPSRFAILSSFLVFIPASLFYRRALRTHVTAAAAEPCVPGSWLRQDGGRILRRLSRLAKPSGPPIYRSGRKACRRTHRRPGLTAN